MRHFIAAALLAAGSAHSQTMVASFGDDQIRVYNKPCETGSVLRFIPEQYRKEFRKAEGRVNGQRYFACAILRDETVIVVWEDGDQGVIQLGAFKVDEGI